MSGGDTTCSHTSPRSSAIDDSRFGYASSPSASLAQVARADRRGLLVDVQPVRLGEEREDAVRVVRRDRLLVLRREVAVHDRRLRALGGVVDRVGVAEPGGVRRQLGEARVALRVELVVLVHERVRRQLVEQHHHDRRARHAAHRQRLRLAREGELGDLAAEQEQQQEHERDRRQDVQEGAHRLGARPQRPPTAAPIATDRTISTVSEASIDFFSACAAISATSAPRSTDVRHLARLRPDQPDQQLDRQQDRRRQHHQQDREADDVEARGAAGGEELGVVLQQVEQRLRDREGPEDGQVQIRPARRSCAAAPSAHHRFGRAK